MKKLALLIATLVPTLVVADARTSLDAAFAVYAAAWDKAPFHIATAALSDGPAQGYGIFNPRTSATFKKDETIHLYVEPRGYGIDDTQAGVFRFGVEADLLLTDTKGTVLFQKRGFINQTLVSRRTNREFFINGTLTLTGAPAGDYVVELVVKDKVGGTSGKAALPITLVD